MTTVINNKQILKNTIYLYFRMFFIMAVSLYTVRVVLRELGVIDYGLYNVVGSVVALCSFLIGSLTAASNRFFSQEIVKNDKSSFNKIFCLNITVFGVLILFAVILLETIGLWYVNTKMVIPDDRMFAANVVYQLSVLSLISTFISIPYTALIIAHEKMSIYAYFGIIESLSKLGIAYIITICSSDKLIIYALLSTLVSILIAGFYVTYCRANYYESKFRLYWNRHQFTEVFRFISLYFFGSISSVVRSQGMNLLINVFFSPAINASRAVAVQVESATKKFSDGYFTAAKPQIYKAYANKEFAGLNRLIQRITLMCVFLMTIFIIPISFNIEYVLTLWLGEIPNKATAFLMLILIDSCINVSSEPIIMSILATGKQGKYQLCEFILRCVSIPIAYVFLFFGSEPESTVMVCIALSLCAVFARIYFLKRSMSEFDETSYIKTLSKIAICIAVVVSITNLLRNIHLSGFSHLLVSTVFSSFTLAITFYYIAMSKQDRQHIRQLLENSIIKFKSK